MSFKYERLPNICYWCRCLDHFNRDCDKWIDSDGTLDSSNKKYEPWIRAPLPQIRCKPVVVVPGFYETRKKGGLRWCRLVEKKAAPLSREEKVQGSHAHQSVGKETVVAEVQFGEAVNALDDISLKPTELKGDHDGNKGDFMEKQIREIDRELNDFDILGSNDREVAATHNEVHVANPLHETKLDLPSATETGYEDGAGHVDHLYSQNPGTNKNLKPNTQASSIARVCKEGWQARTWTRVARAAQRVE